MSQLPCRAGTLVFWASFGFAVLSCGSFDPQEKVQSLRGIGSTVTPLVTQPSVDSDDSTTRRTVTVNLLVAAKPDQTITVEPFVDIPVGRVINLTSDKIAVGAQGEPQDFPGVRLIATEATLVVPTVSEMFGTFFSSTGRIRYGFKVTSGAETEYIVGSFLVYPEGSDELNWQPLEVTFNKPDDDAEFSAEEEIDISGDVTNPNDEDIKFRWFVTGGSVENRRAHDTTWKLPKESGQYSIIATARGKKSRSFHYLVRKVQVK